MASFGSKDNQLHMVNMTDEDFYVLVSPDAEWEMADTIVEAVKEGAQKASQVRGSFKSFARTLKMGAGVRETAELAEGAIETIDINGKVSKKQAQAAISKVQHAAFLLKANSDPQRLVTLCLLDTSRYFTASGWAAIAGCDDVTLTIWSASGGRVLIFDSNSDHSWIIQKEDVVRAEYGKLHVPAKELGCHRFDVGQVVLHAGANYLPVFEDVKTHTDGRTERRGVKPVTLKEGWYYLGRPELSLKSSDTYDSPKTIPGDYGPKSVGGIPCHDVFLGYTQNVQSIRVDPGARITCFYNGSFCPDDWTGDPTRAAFRVYTSDALDCINTQTWFVHGQERIVRQCFATFIVDDADQILRLGERIQWVDGRGLTFSLVFEPDGELVQYVDCAVPNGGMVSAVMWSTGTHCSGGTCVRQADGNLVIRNAQGLPVWQSGVIYPPIPGMRLILRTDGSFAIGGPGYPPRIIWKSPVPRIEEDFVVHYKDSDQVRAARAAANQARPESPPLSAPKKPLPLLPVETVTPANGATGVATLPVLSWRRVPDATSYMLFVGRANMVDEVHLIDNIRSESCSMTSLLSLGGDFVWWVRAFDADGRLIGESPIQSFSTIVVPAPTPGALAHIPKLASPVDGSTVPSLTPYLSWTAGATGWATRYQVQVSTQADFLSTVLDNFVPISASALQASFLGSDTTYFWRVRASNDAGASPWSLSFKFTTAAAELVPTSLLTPRIWPTTVEETGMRVSWHAVPGAKCYGLQVSDAIDFKQLLIDEPNVGEASYVCSGLASGTGYFCRVIAKNGPVASDWSPLFAFLSLWRVPLNLEMWGDADYRKVPDYLGLVSKLATGAGHTVALKVNGTVSQWGKYQLATISATRAVDIAAGQTFTVVLTEGGDMLVSRIDGTAAGDLAAPVELAGKVKAIAAGSGHVVALLKDGTVRAWGGPNRDGQTNVPATLMNVKAIAAGVYHSAALLDDGTVVTWGGNQGSAEYPGEQSVPKGLTAVKKIAAGDRHVLALKRDMTVVQWGSVGAETVPVGLTDVVAIAAFGNQSAALTVDGKLRIWGEPSGLVSLAQGAPLVATALSVSLGRTFGVVLLGTPEAHAMLVTASIQDAATFRSEIEAAAKLKADADAKLLADAQAAEAAEAARLANITPGTADIGHWRFNGDGSDESGQGHPAKLQGGVVFVKDFKASTSALVLGEIPQYACTDAINLGNACTISVWVNVSSNQLGTNSMLIASSPPTGNTNGFKLYVHRVGASPGRLLVFESGNGGTPQGVDSTGYWVSDGQWTHVVLVIKRAEGRSVLFINGAHVGFGNTDKAYSNNLPLFFGGYGAAQPGGGLVGKLADVRVFGKAFSADDVKVLYNKADADAATAAAKMAPAPAPAPAPTPAPAPAPAPAPIVPKQIASWKLNGDGSDTSGGGRTAYLLGGASFVPGAFFGGAAVALNGAGAYIDAGTINVGNTFTFTAWIKLSSPVKNSSNTIIAASGSLATNGFCLSVNSWNTSDLRLVLDSGNGRTSASCVTTTNAVPSGKWTHIAVSVNCGSGNATLYLNGSQIAANGGVQTDFATNLPIRIGQLSDGNFGFQGQIADVRIYNTVLAPADVAAIASQQVVADAQAAAASAVSSTVDLALGKTATASSNEVDYLSASLVLDGNPATRWASSCADSNWICVDLGSNTTFNRVVLKWEFAFGKSYELQVSSDGQSWTTVYRRNAGAGGEESLTFAPVTARFVRMWGTERGTPYGYSLWSFQVYHV